MGNLQANPSSSTQTIEKKTEVFLNFRGLDTRHGFTNYLYEGLRVRSIETFMDDHGIPKGDEIGPKLLQTIRESKISVVIFSKEYASSKWCLRELAEIMESGQTVIPVFYKVSVSDVGDLEGSFMNGFDKLKKDFYEKLEKEQVDFADVEKRKKEFDEEMQKWRQALKDASHVKGWSYENGPESKVIDEIIKDIWEKLMRANKLSLCDFTGLFGFEERFKHVTSLLCLENSDIRIIGIWGMGGIGKTTIPDAIFHQISCNEYGKCFIRNVRQRLEQYGGLVSVLQQEVLSKVLNDQDIKLDGVTLPEHIKRRLHWKKVFIVLDDVDDFLKLQELAAGLDQLGPGSRIIITTRRRDILYNCGVNDDYIYEVKGLSNQEAHQLFCEYAFRQSPPVEDLMALSHEILWAINGNPLALKVAGSSLLGLNKLEWQSALTKLKKSPEILEVLQISYNTLAPEHKDIFLDIACFYVGEHKDYVAEILDNCSHSFKVLSDRSLITISKDKIIQMHDLLQEMGKEIVCKEDLNNPGNRSRLLTQEDILDILKNGDGTNAVRGISLNMSIMNEEHLSSQAFKKMKNLRFLKFYDSTFYEWYCFTFNGFELYSSNVHFPNNISYLSNKLRSLNWLGYPLKALPSNFIPKHLVELNLRHSNIEKLWEDNMHAPKLKWIILKGCPYLIKVLDLLDAPLLEKIDIEYCESLFGLHSRNHFPSLTYLHLKNCNKLTRISDFLDAPLLEKIDIYECENLLGFPSPVHHFNNLHELNLRYCENLQSFPNNIPFPSLVSLDLSGCINLQSFPNNIAFPSLISLNLSRCINLQSFPNNIPFPSLVSLDLSECINLVRISELLDAPLLEKINLYHCSSLLDFPPPAQHFNNLRELNLRDCKNFKSFPNNIPFPSLVSLDLSECINLARISDLLDAPLLEMINLSFCKSLLHFPPPPPFQHFNNLRDLDLRYCDNLQSFSSNNIHFPSHTYLDFCGCFNLTKFPHISGKIKRLYMENTAIDEVPSSIENLLELVELDLSKCTRLKHISVSICKLKALTELYFTKCFALECFPEISATMENLQILDLSETAIKELHHSIENLIGLNKLFLRNCKNLEMLPISIHNLTSLEILDLSGCSKLENLPGNSVTDLCGCSTTKPPICITNSLSLNMTTIKTIMEIQINQHRVMTRKGCETQAINLNTFYPGSEVPDWFKYQTDGSSMYIQMSSHDGVNGHLIGLAACAVIEFYDFEIDISYWYHCHCYYGYHKIKSIKVSRGNKRFTDYVALWYSDASFLELCGSECTNYLFTFFFQKKSPNCRVKYCGVCPIYEKHNITLPSIANETFGVTDQDFGETSVKEPGKIRKFSDEAATNGRSNEEVIEPHPKRSCS